jgi:hypothetical protein
MLPTWLSNRVAEPSWSAGAPWPQPIGSGGIPGAHAGTWATCREPRNVAADGELQRSMSVRCRQPAAHDANCNCHSKQLAAGWDHGVRTEVASRSCLQMGCEGIKEERFLRQIKLYSEPNDCWDWYGRAHKCAKALLPRPATPGTITNKCICC